MVDSLIADHIDPVLGGVQVGDLTAEGVEDFLDARTDPANLLATGGFCSNH